MRPFIDDPLTAMVAAGSPLAQETEADLVQRRCHIRLPLQAGLRKNTLNFEKAKTQSPSAPKIFQNN